MSLLDKILSGDSGTGSPVRLEIDLDRLISAIDNLSRDVSENLGAHAATHIKGGGDEIDGDQLDIDWNPAYYTPATTPVEVDNVDHLTAHLYGIDQYIGALSSGITPASYPLPHLIAGDLDPGTHVHFHVQVSTSLTFGAPVVDKESKTAQTNWYYFDGTQFSNLPAGGVVADYTWAAAPAPWANHVEPANFTNSIAIYVVPAGVLTAGTTYYVRWREWDVEGGEPGGWSGEVMRV